MFSLHIDSARTGRATKFQPASVNSRESIFPNDCMARRLSSQRSIDGGAVLALPVAVDPPAAGAGVMRTGPLISSHAI